MTSSNDSLLQGRATPEGTKRYAARFAARAASGHFRVTAGILAVSSIGIGTYLGDPNWRTDTGYTDAVVEACKGGLNLIDTAINYRLQRSERSVGAALTTTISQGFAREEFIVCTKAGFLTPDGAMPDDVNDYFVKEYIEPGIMRAEDIAAGCHCMAPRFLADQIERSRKNLGIECVDVFYLHNPETQLTEISAGEFRDRVRRAFEFLESAVDAGKIGFYGLATWNAFREEPLSSGYLSLEAMISIAREVGGDAHHCRFVQLPLNLAMPEALTKANQVAQGKTLAMVQAARPLGVSIIASASLLQGQLTRTLPPYVRSALGLKTDAQRALQFVRSAPGVTAALVGMSSPEHVAEAIALATAEPAPRDQFLKLFGQGR